MQALRTAPMRHRGSRWPSLVFCTGVLTLGTGLQLPSAIGSPTDAGANGALDLLSLLNQQTDLATKSRINADYVPGMATILNGDELLARGARTVWEALGLVPGISLGIEFTGERQILSRGVGHGYASGNVKIMLDGRSMNSTLLATANPVLNLPIENVERIEVVRGPGSSVYGEYAYAGVVNVITRRDRRAVYLRGSSEYTYGAGGSWFWRDPDRDLSLSINLAGREGNGPDVQVTEDALVHTGQQSLSHAPGDSNEAIRYGALMLALEGSEWNASLKLMDDRYGDHFGINHFLPPPDHRLASRHTYRTLALGRKLTVADNLYFDLQVEGLQHDRDRDRLYVYPAGLYGDDRVYMDLSYLESRLHGAVDLHWQPIERHDLLLGVEVSQVEIDHASWDWYGLPFEVPAQWIDPDRQRTIVSITGQNQYRVNDDITVTATVRHDDYSDVGAMTSPRLAAVWRMNQENIVKLQYARAFRPPTFYELEYPGSGHISPSEITTYEVGYILKQPQWEGRITLFQSDLDEPITFDELGVGGFVNDDEVRLRGVEFEYQRRLTQQLKLDANLSYVDASYRTTGNKLPGGASWLGNAGLLWQPAPSWSAALQLRYVGERARSELDSRSPLPSVTTLDLTLGYRHPRWGLGLWGGVKNLTDEDVRFPDQLTTDLEGEFYLPYPSDYPRPGREWWVSASIDF